MTPVPPPGRVIVVVVLSDIEYYVNFEDATAYDCDYRLEFKVTFQSATAENSFNRYISNNIAWIAANESDWDVTWTQ